MSNIDKQAVQAVADLKAGYTLGHADVAILNELAHIALTSLEAEPAIHRWRRVTVEPYGPYPWHYGNFIGFSKPVDGIEDEYYYSAPPAPVSDSLLSELLAIAKKAADAADECAHAEWSDDSMEHSTAIADWERRAAMLQGAEPVSQPYTLPDGYCIMPMKLTAENGAKCALAGEFSETKFISCPECFGDDECETCDGTGRIEISVPVSWTTIKDIWAKGVEHFAEAAPQQE